MEERFLSSSRNCIIMVCCWSIGVFILGTSRLSGQLFVACMVRYNARRKDASFPFSLSFTIRNIAGPLIGYLGRKYGAEAVTVSGCLLSAVGVGACFFAEHMDTVIVFWGVIYGLGFGLGSVLVPGILDTYFKKHYDKANGVFLGGSSLSAMLLPLIAEKSLLTYGTSGTFLILSGLMLHSVVAGYILWNFKRRMNPVTVKLKPAAIHNNPKDHNTSFRDIELTKMPVESLKEKSKPPGDHSGSSGQDPIGTKPHNNYKPPKQTGATQTLDEVTETLKKKEDKNIILEMFQMFLDPAFIIILTTQSSAIFLFTVIWTVIIDFSRDAGVSTDQEVYVLMGLAITDSAARFVLGSITDAGYMSKSNFSALCFGLLGASMLSLVAMNGIVMMMIAACAIGLFIGGQLMIGSGIILSHIEREKVIIVLSCRYMMYPILGFAQPYLIAYFRDTMGSYNGLFYFVTGVSLVCCFLTMLLPMATRIRDKNKHRFETDKFVTPSP